MYKIWPKIHEFRLPSFRPCAVRYNYKGGNIRTKIKVLKVEITVCTVLTRNNRKYQRAHAPPTASCVPVLAVRTARLFEAALRHGHAVSGIHSAASTLELKPSGKVFSQSIFTWLGLG